MSPIRSLYDWTLKQAEGRYASWVLFVVSFAEASFFPLPPDILLLPMAMANRAKAYQYALICTIGSVLGGLLGYAIGALLYESIGQWIIHTYHLHEAFQRFHDGFNEWGAAIIIGKGFTPIPFKLVTIASGVAGLSIAVFILSSILTRGARFFLVAWLVKKYGEPIRTFIERYLTWVALGVLSVIILGFWLVLH